MSRALDKELAEAIQVTDDEGPTSTPGLEKHAEPPSAPSQARPPSRSVGLLLTLLTMVGAVVTLFLVGFKEAAIYATPIDELATDNSKLIGRKVRIEGELVPGTLVKRDQPCEYRFTVHGQKTELPVRYSQCVIPDTFRDMPGGGVQVTVEGALTEKGTFEASLVMAKCASKYDPTTHEMKDSASLPVN